MKFLSLLSFAFLASAQSKPSSSQIIGHAAYINPIVDPTAWTRMIASPSNKVGLLVANPNNGPDSSINADFATVITQTVGSGKKLLGYVRTGYLSLSADRFTTRSGSTTIDAWKTQIKGDIDLWYQLNPKLSGIFFDECWNQCGASATSTELAQVYKDLSNYVKNKFPGAYTVANPGATIPQCYENAMDTLMTFEGSFDTYTKAYVPNDWTSSTPNKVWHLVYGVPEDQVAKVAALSKERGAGLIGITSGTLPNPYNILPSAAYEQKFQDSVSGGSLTAAAPNGPSAKFRRVTDGSW